MQSSVSQRFPRSPESVREARRFVSGTLASWGLTERIDDVVLCVSELATNAICHAVPTGGGFLVNVTSDGELLRIEVHDMSRRRPRVRHPDNSDSNGRGLLITDAVSDAWGVKPRAPRGKIVWTEFKIAAQRSRSTPQLGAC